MRQTPAEMTQSRSGTTIRLAALQPDLTIGQPMPNLHLIRRTVDALVAEEALDLLVLPEDFAGTTDPMDPAKLRRFLQTLAKAGRTFVVGGSLSFRDESGAAYNTCFIVDRQGREVGRYDKRVLFSDEASKHTAGTKPCVFALDGVRVGVLICADLWHPERTRELCDKIDVLAVPAKTSVPSEAHTVYARSVWHALALTRATENGFATVVSDWPSARHDSFRVVDGVRTRQTHFTSGASCVIDPSHRPNIDQIVRVLPKGQPGVIQARIDLDSLVAYREYRRKVGLLPPLSFGPGPTHRMNDP